MHKITSASGATLATQQQLTAYRDFINAGARLTAVHERVKREASPKWALLIDLTNARRDRDEALTHLTKVWPEATTAP